MPDLLEIEDVKQRQNDSGHNFKQYFEDLREGRERTERHRLGFMLLIDLHRRAPGRGTRRVATTKDNAKYKCTCGATFVRLSDQETHASKYHSDTPPCWVCLDKRCTADWFERVALDEEKLRAHQTTWGVDENGKRAVVIMGRHGKCLGVKYDLSSNTVKPIYSIVMIKDSKSNGGCEDDDSTSLSISPAPESPQEGRGLRSGLRLMRQSPSSLTEQPMGTVSLSGGPWAPKTSPSPVHSTQTRSIPQLNHTNPKLASSCSEVLSDRYSWPGDTDWQTMSEISEAISKWKRKRTSPAVWRASDEAQSKTAEDLEHATNLLASPLSSNLRPRPRSSTLSQSSSNREMQPLWCPSIEDAVRFGLRRLAASFLIQLDDSRFNQHRLDMFRRPEPLLQIVTAPLLAAARDRSEMLQLLLNYEHDLSQPAIAQEDLGFKDPSRLRLHSGIASISASELTEAVKDHRWRSVIHLCESGALTSEYDSDGFTPLGRAVARRAPWMVRILIQLGANLKSGRRLGVADQMYGPGQIRDLIAISKTSIERGSSPSQAHRRRSNSSAKTAGPMAINPYVLAVHACISNDCMKPLLAATYAVTAVSFGTHGLILPALGEALVLRDFKTARLLMRTKGALSCAFQRPALLYPAWLAVEELPTPPSKTDLPLFDHQELLQRDAFEFILGCSIRSDQARIVQDLYESTEVPIEINTRFSKGLTALHLAASYGALQCLKWLLEAGANPETGCSKDGWLTSPWRRPVPPDKAYTAGAHPPDIRVITGGTAVELATRAGHTLCVRRLLATSEPGIQSRALLDAAHKGFWDIVVELLNGKARFDGDSVLQAFTFIADHVHWRTRLRETCCRLLEAADPDPGSTRLVGTAIVRAALQNRIEIARWLVEKYRVREVSDEPRIIGRLLPIKKELNKALMSACQLGHVETMCKLLDVMTEQWTDESGETCLFQVVAYGQLDCLKALLLNRGIDINVRNVAGETCLFGAVNLEYNILEPLLALLVPVSPDLSARDSQGRSILGSLLAQPHCSPLNVKLLLSYGASAASLPGESSHQILPAAVRFRDLDLLQKLLLAGAAIDGVDSTGRTAVVEAVNLGWAAGVQFLRARGASASSGGSAMVK